MKYIIDLPDNTHWIQWIMEGTKDHHPYTAWRDAEDLTPYTEPDRRAIEDEVWEVARLITLKSHDGGLNPDELYRCFGNRSIQDVMKTHSYQEAKAEYELWKKQEDEFHIGDECVDEDGDKCVVVFNVDDNICDIIYDDGSTDKVHKEILKKTGKNYHEITEVLKMMNGIADLT